MNHLRESDVQYIHYKDPLAIRTTSDLLITYLPKKHTDIVIVCIGTDRSTGDSLGPLTGMLLSKMNLVHIRIYGTLHEPVHAINLQEKMAYIRKTYDNPFIIAVDASLGKSQSIGSFISGTGPLRPGAALNKQLPPIGDAYVTGVVNVGGFMDYTVLQSTRLSVVHDMSYKLALIFKKVDIWLNYYNLNTNRNALRKEG